ncbi:peptidoglycan-binding protein [Salipaludibacillus sp. CUR1]|uniref:peptidoglycan-binding protein n=1 Tax=Salipaludibacillus sp. CUR1 TaxID=2820003 RepID=UPI001E39B9BB|nr:peptidoglycan-binding protein [Salipaludibacillus sp. CUR1]MCE7793657.1 peptidoglycan-binding protein [Salipaludibacillus sp. CUR1]
MKTNKTIRSFQRLGISAVAAGAVLFSGAQVDAAGGDGKEFGEKLLYTGQSNEHVLELKDLLSENGIFGEPETGAWSSVYTSATENAVRQFQQKYGLLVDGVAGNQTVGALSGLEKGDEGELVTNLQEDLEALGYYNFGVDGIFGPVTEQAVIDLQNDEGVQDEEGVAGPYTYAALYEQLGKYGSASQGTDSAEATESTEEATEEATEEVTEEATEEATEEVTEEATEEATEETTEEATEEATEETTEEATEEATEETTEEATEESAEEATEESSDVTETEAAEEAAEESAEASTETADAGSTEEATEETSEEAIEEAEQTEQSTEETASEGADGETLTMEATAYTAFCEGCTGITYTGQDLRNNPDKKVVAVDPNVIPLGSIVEVEGYGQAVAGDIGGAIQGNRIDLHVATKEEALEFGRRDVEVTVVETP